MFARLPEPHFPKYTCLLLSDQPTFQGKVPKGKKARTRVKIGGRGGFSVESPRMALQVDLWTSAQAWNLWLDGKGEGRGVQRLVTLAEAETAVPISHRSPL